MVSTKRRWWIGGAALVVIFAGAAVWWLGQTPHGGFYAATPERIAQGMLIYDHHCASCHGHNLEGQPNWQKRLPNGMLPVPPHDATGHTWHHADAELFEMTKNGPAALVPGYASDMPSFAGVLRDDEIRDVLAYIKSRWPPDIAAKQKQIDEAYERSRR